MLATVLIIVVASDPLRVLTASSLLSAPLVPSHSNFLAMVDLAGPQCQWAALTGTYAGVNCTTSTVSKGVLYSICKVDLSAGTRGPRVLDVRAVATGEPLRPPVPLQGVELVEADWEVAVSARSGALLLFETGAGGRVARLNVTTGRASILASLPRGLLVGWVFPTSTFDALSQTFYTLVEGFAGERAHTGRVSRSELLTSAVPSSFSLLSLQVSTNVTRLTPLSSSEPSVLSRGIFNTAHWADASGEGRLVGLMYNNSLVELNVSTGLVRVLCPDCAAVVGIPSLETMAVASVGGSGGVPVIVARFDTKFAPGPGLQPAGPPHLYTFDAASGWRVRPTCVLPSNLSYGLTLNVVC